MLELKFRGKLDETLKVSTRCECAGIADTSEANKERDICCHEPQRKVQSWIIGTVRTPTGMVTKVSTALSKTDYWGHVKCRTTAYRNDYMVDPGLYATGNPEKDSDVFVSANYKFSFDVLRRRLEGFNAWILVLDTKGINVWCAAGKGSFGTEELVRRISSVHLDKIVAHRRVIVPQLGAPGVSAFRVKKATGFRVLYGPADAKDIPDYIRAGYKATKDMRKVKFSFLDRLVLTPMEIIPAMKKYPLFALLMLVIFGLMPSGIFFREALIGGLPFLLLGFISVLAGGLITPLFLPYIPLKSFAGKGWIAGVLSVFLSTKYIPLLNQQNTWLLIIAYLFFPLASSYIALQFTGSTTFTGMSGVKKELRIAVPIYISICTISLLLLITFKIIQWGVI